jgi:polysaccharide biosynthesis protein PslH
MKILQVCYKMPYPPTDGGAYSLFNFASSLLRTNSVELTVLAMRLKKNKEGGYPLPPQFLQQTNFASQEVDNRVRPFQALVNLFSNKSYLSERFYCKKFERKLIETIQRGSFDIIQLEHAYLGNYLEAIRRVYTGKIILRAQNVEHALWESYLQKTAMVFPLKIYLRQMTKKLAQFERRLLQQIDGLICLSEQDQLKFQDMYRVSNSTRISIAFDEYQLPAADVPCQQLCIYHLGSMDWLPNLQGIEWFLHRVFPVVLRNQPDTVLRLAGKHMPSSFYKKEGKNLIVDGEVPHAIDYQMDKPILIVPILSGGGIRVKIIEALALGKAIVSTTKGAEGLHCTDGLDILLADDPTQFAQCILLCLENKAFRENLGANARKLYEKHHTLKNTGAEALSFYRGLLAEA